MSSVLPLSRLATYVNGRPFKPEEKSLVGLPIVRIRQFVDPEAELDFFDGPVEQRHLLADGDLVFSWSATLVVGLWNRGPAVLNQHLFNVHPLPGVEKRWLRWALESSLRRFAGMMHGSAMTHITKEMLRDVFVTVPSVEVQRRVADFLDEEVTHLDRRADVIWRTIKLLEARAEAMIGDEIAPVFRRDGQYSMVPMRRLLRKLNRPVPEGHRQMVTAFRDGQVIARSLRRPEGFTDSWTEASAVQGVWVGDIVIHGLDGFSGAVGTSESSGVCSPANHVCRPRDGGDPDFYGRMLRMLALSGYLSLFGGSARERAVDYRTWSSFASTKLPAVNPPAQRRIGEMIRSARPLRPLAIRQQGLISERKQALIMAAVTGDFDVAAASGRRVA